MKLNFSLFNASSGNTKILIAGLAIIIATNVVALAGVAYNRSGNPEAQIELTERELAMPHRYRMNKENRGHAKAVFQILQPVANSLGRRLLFDRALDTTQ